MAYAMTGKQLAASKANDKTAIINETTKKPAKKASKKTKKGPAFNQELTQ